MKILLVRPPVPRQTIGLKHIMICEPLELEYVAAGLPEHEVAIFDGILENKLIHKLNRFKPDIVGISSYINGVNELTHLCRKVKIWNNSCLTIVGGVHASRCPEDFADASIDCIVLGDGTFAISRIIEALKTNKDLYSVPGLALPQSNKTVYRTANIPYMQHPDTLPFPRRDLVAHLHHRYYYVFFKPLAIMKTSWGCQFRCNFCFNWTVTNGTVFYRSPESIADELAQIPQRDIYIVDDIFLFNYERLTRLAELLESRGIQKKYLVFGRADFIARNEPLIRRWAALGLSAVLVGLEASTDEELNSMDKQSSINLNIEAIQVLQRANIDIYGSFIIQPTYTHKDWKRLYKFIQQNNLYYLNISPLTPLPGTASWEHHHHELIVPREAHSLWDLSHTVLPTTQPLKKYYRSLLGVYFKTVMNLTRAHRIKNRSTPPVFSRQFLSTLISALKIAIQLFFAHKHHATLLSSQLNQTKRITNQ